MSQIYLREDLLDKVTELLVRSSCTALDKERTNQLFVDFLVKLVHNQRLKDGVMENLVYSSTRSFFTLGYSSVDAQLQEEQRLWEKDMAEKRKIIAETYIEDRTVRNKYKPDQ